MPASATSDKLLLMGAILGAHGIKGEVKVNEQQPSGQPAIAHVCRVKYKPIAGHKADAENSYLATTDAIEVSLRPIPSANVLVPYQITIPTLLGYATIVSARSGETEDAFMSDLAAGTAAGQIKIGSLRTSSTVAKYNQLLRIEEDSGAPYAGIGALARRR